MFLIRSNEVKLVPQFLVNNPNISITPTRSNQSPTTVPKQSPVSAVNRVSIGNLFDNYLNIYHKLIFKLNILLFIFTSIV